MALLRSQEFEDMFYGYTKAANVPRSTSHEAVAKGDWTPRIDIVETDKKFIIKAEIPDVTREDVKVTINNGVLTIQGVRKQKKEDNGEKFHRIGHYYGSFTHSLSLPDNIDVTKIKATFKDDVLNLQIQKIKVTGSKTIVVKVE